MSAAPLGRAFGSNDELPFVDLDTVPAERAAAQGFPPELLRTLGAFPYAVDSDGVRVAVSEPEATLAEALAAWTDLPLRFARAAPALIARRVEELAAARPSLSETFQFEAEGLDSDAPAVARVARLLAEAAERRASDLHLLPRAGGLRVRIRVDGIVSDLDQIPAADASGIVSRLKVLAKLDIAEHRRPQDGRFSVGTTSGRSFDVRVAVLPAVAGEGVVLRLLEKSRKPASVADLGMSEPMEADFDELMRSSTWGALLVTGPTGSGKSTTLNSVLAQTIRPDVNVITVEDPVEYEIPDALQLQVGGLAGLTFPAALRSVLRGDPDVIMVGEIRDEETARIALAASLAGHVVFSTLHTRNAAGALTRLTEMGVEPYIVASGLSAVIAQRLARRLCPHCREPYQPSAEILAALGPEAAAACEQAQTFYRPRGCARCSIGYSGRVGIFQLLRMSEELRRLTAACAPQSEIERAAAADGTSSLWADGLAKAAAGITSLDELVRVLA
jgi:type II secretory ATPase GspE/PulE/Tfp pilus assembly ATPase PilB-like protein